MTNPVRNRALIQARDALRMSQRQLAVRMREVAREMGKRNIPDVDSVERAIQRCEAGTTRRPSAEFYLPVFCAALGKTATELFGDDSTAGGSGLGDGLSLVSHKFVPVFIGADAAKSLGTDPDFVTSHCEWLHTRSISLDHPDGSCTLTVFDFGVAVFHLVEEHRFDSIAELALWRRHTTNATWRASVTALLSRRWPNLDAAGEYVLSAYWITDHSWSGGELTTAMKLLSMPSVLLDRDRDLPDDKTLAKASFDEHVHLRDGFDDPEITPFGVDGVALGFASWAGVSYLPLAPQRAILADELTTFETLVQALWCYTDMLATREQHGLDPEVPDEFGWRFLRACRSRLNTAQAREHNQVRRMRDAILRTSNLDHKLQVAVEHLRELNLVGR
ncbi:hypothetical protein SUDANB95_07952 (plasmid) [Actinosynnema sp. ALI-1.44]